MYVVMYLDPLWLTDTARIASGEESRKRSCVRPSVCLSVCPIMRPQPRRAASLLLSAVRAGDIDR